MSGCSSQSVARLLAVALVGVLAACSGGSGGGGGKASPKTSPSTTAPPATINLSKPIPGGSLHGTPRPPLENTGTASDRLLRASTPAAARVELHTMSMDGGVMRMREVEAIPLAAGETVKMRPGQGFHLMLMQLKAPLKVGDAFPLVLEFERGGRVEVRVDVQQPQPLPRGVGPGRT